MTTRDPHDFAVAADAAGLRLRADRAAMAKLRNTPTDTQFYVPLLALAILVVARRKSDGLHTSELTTWTCATLARNFTDAEAAKQRFRWSFEIRRRCADALVFLENVGLVTIREDSSRLVKLTVPGLDFLRKCSDAETDVGRLTRALVRSYTVIQKAGLDLF